jgi:uncharacterized membrane protein YbhN (UPF0104 family)
MFFFLAVLGLASTIPSAPGYLGTYQLVGITVLVPLGWNRDESLAFATLLQAMVMGCSVLLGLPGLWRFRRLGGNPVAANPLRPGQPAGAD